jgi:pyrroline-5-carboxylate reductase
MKPQGMEEAARLLAPLMRRAVTISIAAGVPVAKLKAWTGAASLVRAMPNLPASISQGVTAAFASPGVSPAQMKLAQRLLAAGGAVVWTRREARMNAVTAVSGSGPAYVFLLVEALEDAGVSAGLPRALAGTLARKTVEGAGALLAALPDAPPGALRRSVTSPGGTTAAALDVLMAADGLPLLMRRAVAAAAARAAELGG